MVNKYEIRKFSLINCKFEFKGGIVKSSDGIEADIKDIIIDFD